MTTRTTKTADTGRRLAAASARIDKKVARAAELADFAKREAAGKTPARVARAATVRTVAQRAAETKAPAPRAPKAAAPETPKAKLLTPEAVQKIPTLERLALAKAEAAAVKEWKRTGSGDKPATAVLDVLNSADYAQRRDAAKVAKATGDRSDSARRAWETRKANALAKTAGTAGPAVEAAAKGAARARRTAAPSVTELGKAADAAKSIAQRRGSKAPAPTARPARKTAASKARPKVGLRPATKAS